MPTKPIIHTAIMVIIYLSVFEPCVAQEKTISPKVEMGALNGHSINGESVFLAYSHKAIAKGKIIPTIGIKHYINSQSAWYYFDGYHDSSLNMNMVFARNKSKPFQRLGLILGLKPIITKSEKLVTYINLQTQVSHYDISYTDCARLDTFQTSGRPYCAEKKYNTVFKETILDYSLGLGFSLKLSKRLNLESTVGFNAARQIIKDINEENSTSNLVTGSRNYLFYTKDKIPETFEVYSHPLFYSFSIAYNLSRE